MRGNDEEKIKANQKILFTVIVFKSSIQRPGCTQQIECNWFDAVVATRHHIVLRRVFGATPRGIGVLTTSTTRAALTATATTIGHVLGGFFLLLFSTLTCK